MIVRYIAFDLETGGVEEGCSVLTAYFRVLDVHNNKLDDLHLLVKPNDGVYNITSEAMEINGIDIIKHDRVAIPYSQAGQLLRNFLVKNSDNGKIKLIPLGKNITGDIKWVNESILGQKTWNMYVSYRIWEVTTLALAAQKLGKMPHDMSISLGSLVKYFDIKVGGGGGLHNEVYDTKATIAVSEALLKLISS